MADAALSFRDVSRSFGSRTALHRLSFDIPTGAVAAFVGANGAGKTTTFSIVGEYIRPQSGTVEVFGEPLHSYRRRGGQLGILPQDVQFFEHRTVARQLYLFARLSGLSGSVAWREVERVLELVSLRDRANERADQLSHGMRVRLATAQACIAEPPLILLDEPTAGLDPLMVQDFRRLVARLKGSTTLVISSHDLGNLEQLCDYVVMINQGQLVRQGSMSRLVQSSSMVRYRLDLPFASFAELRQTFSQFEFDEQGSEIIVRYDASNMSPSAVNKVLLPFLLERDARLTEVVTAGSLEEAFVEAVRP